ncbi:tetratricopeptide repeat protein [Alkalihalobacillus sp. R86527]|uniref:tetratricopeptide repeat protein n=1 Tax=Alkalihalobacillus sp. R86527 TaxID=3093863 RepID=UPI00367192E1
MIEQKQSVTLISNHKPVQLRIERMAIHHRMKILKTVKANGSKFYLFFYQNDFITGKSIEVQSGSLIEKAFQDGIVLNAPHPLITKFLEPHTIVLKSTKHVLQNIQKKYSPQEVVFIFSYFDSFLPKEKIMQLQRKYFYEYRRNGQLRLAFQILMVALYADFSTKWAQELSNQLEFQKVKSIYEWGGRELHEADPLYAEINAYKDLASNKTYLDSLYKRDGRKIDHSALTLKMYLQSSHNQNEQSLPAIDFPLSNHERALLLWNMYSEAPHLNVLRKQVFQSLIELKKTTEAINLLASRQDEITEKECEQMIEAFQDLETDMDAIELTLLQKCLCVQENRRHLPLLLQTLVPKLLERYDIDFVFDWLKPLYEDNKDLPILTTIQTMAEIQDDPDKQFQLGKLYHKLSQYDEAIKCFDWEMEMHPTDPTPVQWLTKVYREMGKIEESNTYMSIYTQMQRVSN